MKKHLRLLIACSAVVTALILAAHTPKVPQKPAEPAAANNTNTPVYSDRSATNSQKPKSSPKTFPIASIATSSQFGTPAYQNPLQKELPDKRIHDQVVAADGSTYPLRVYRPLSSPNDPSANQWWVSQTGLNAAWDVTPGARATTVAIIDSGFALNHQEFTNRWALNSGEQGTATSQAASRLNCTARGLALNKSCNLIDDDFDGIVDNESGATTVQNPSKLNCTDSGLALNKSCNNLDDDGNGYIDDVKGWDFSNFDANVQAGEINPGGSNTVHGTMVAGILGATGNNGVGIAGVNWQTKILPIQALDDDGYGDTLTVSRAVRYAADRGADVISISLGSDLGDTYLRQAIDYALDHGAVVVAAAGNDGCDCISYPANYPEVVAVGASTSSGSRASFSSYGTNLDLLAPGQGMTSATWSSGNGTSAYASNIAGTSFSTPYTAGLLALERSHQPDATWGELLATLLENTNHGALSGGVRSDSLGYGFVRADNALSRAITPASPITRYNFAPLSAADTLGSTHAYQCDDGSLATAPLYQMVKSGEIHFTTSELQKTREASSGWAATTAGFACIGLPTDTPALVRTINLNLETVGLGYKSPL